jgi:two-component system OmpR family sensor kinase
MRSRVGIRVWLPLAFALVAAVTAIAVERGVSRGSESAFRERAQELAAGKTFESALEIGTGSASRDLERVVQETAARHRMALFIFAPDGTLLTPRRSRGVELGAVPGNRTALRRALAGRRYVDTSSELRATVVGLPFRAEGLAALIAYAPHPELAAELGLVRDESIEAALWALVLGALIGAVLATLIARRLRRIAAAAASIEGGEFDRPIRARFHDEVGELAESIDRMRGRLAARERFERAEREFVTNAAHELRTPLTTIVGAVEQLQAGSKDVPEERERFLAHLERESARLARLVRALLVLARAQTRQEAPRLVALELRPLLEQAAAAARPAAGVLVEVSCPAGLSALADRDLLEQALSNLVSNAAKYTARGRIDLVAEPAGPSGVVVEVRDTGVGMTPAERETATGRFVRGSVMDADGFGVGLAIVQQAVTALGGELELESAPGQGTTARLRLSAAAERAA